MKIDKSLIIIGILNFIIFQWLFVRLNLQIDSSIENYKTARRPLRLMYFVFPITGWFGIPYFPKKYKNVLLVPGLEVYDAK